MKKSSEGNSVKQKVTVNSSRAANSLYDLLKSVLSAITIMFLCVIFILRPVRVDGSSMNSTLLNNDMVAVTPLNSEIKCGDIVVISDAGELDKAIIKRVIATEGQTLKLDYDNQRVIVDGVILSEPYVNDGFIFGERYDDYDIPEVIPEGKVFVMGDNRGHSMDSRSTRVGLIDRDNIMGKAQFIFFPFTDRFGYLY